MKMKTALSLVAAAVALLSHSAFAQDKSRAEVKEETKKAVKAGETKAGEGQPGAKAEAGKSTQTRAERKADAAKAVKAGDTKAGEGSPDSAKVKSTKDRAERKAEAAAAVKAGETKAGEGQPGQKE